MEVSYLEGMGNRGVLIEWEGVMEVCIIEWEDNRGVLYRMR